MVRLLKLANGQYIVGTEYDPRTNIIHVLNKNYYAYYFEEEKEIEINKAVVDVEEVVYAGETWPSDIQKPTTYSVVMEYFIQGANAE